MDNAGYEIDIRHANGDIEYMYCNKQVAFEQFRPYLALAAYNSQELINDVDINAIYVKNRDPRAYTDK